MGLSLTRKDGPPIVKAVQQARATQTAKKNRQPSGMAASLGDAVGHLPFNLSFFRAACNGLNRSILRRGRDIPATQR
jgi:hypothetical protein